MFPRSGKASARNAFSRLSLCPLGSRFPAEFIWYTLALRGRHAARCMEQEAGGLRPRTWDWNVDVGHWEMVGRVIGEEILLRYGRIFDVSERYLRHVPWPEDNGNNNVPMYFFSFLSRDSFLNRESAHVQSSWGTRRSGR